MSADVEIAVEIIHITRYEKTGIKAVLVYDGSTKVWIPYSVIKDYTGEMEIGESITIFLSEYWAEEKGLI